MTEPTFKEKIEKLLADEAYDPEPCNTRLFATNVARLICEEMVSKCNGCCDGCPSWETAQEILKALE